MRKILRIINVTSSASLVAVKMSASRVPRVLVHVSVWESLQVHTSYNSFTGLEVFPALLLDDVLSTCNSCESEKTHIIGCRSCL